MSTRGEDRAGAGSNRLYGDLAWLWPLLSPPDDYLEEGRVLRAKIAAHVAGPVPTLLHLGCGGGHVDRSLAASVAITAADRSPAMLALARQLNPAVTYVEGDMRSLRLGRLFDVVLIHDAASYLLTADDLAAAFQTAAAHLRPGGVLLALVEHEAGRFEQNETTVIRGSSNDVELTAIENVYDPDPSDTTYELTFVYLIRRHGVLEVCTDHHRQGLFPLYVWRHCVTDAGLELREEPDLGALLPLLVAVQPGPA